jgi:hypothetical protein
MRKYRAEQIMRWLDIRDGWKMERGYRRTMKYLLRKRGKLIYGKDDD